MTLMVWFGLLVFNGNFSTNRLYQAVGSGETHSNIDKPKKKKYTQTLSSTWALWR